MKRNPILRRSAAAVFLLLLGSAASQGREPELQSLQSLDQLEAAFNRDVGSPRIVLLLSPT